MKEAPIMSNARKAKPLKTVDPDFAPIVIDTSTPAVDSERITAFTIDGAEHTIPRRLPAGDTVRMLEVIAERGPVAGAWEMVKLALGEDSITALMECRHVTHDQVKDIFDRIGRLYMGQVDDLAGK
jgi:hypothetical protein